MKRWFAALTAMLMLLTMPAALGEVWNFGDEVFTAVELKNGGYFRVNGYLSMDHMTGEYLLYPTDPLQITMDGTDITAEKILILSDDDLTMLDESRVYAGGIVRRSSAYSTGVAITDAHVVSESEYMSVEATGNVNLRDDASLNASIIGVMAKGETAEYLGIRTEDDRGVEWYYVHHERMGEGWVSSAYARLVNAEPPAIGYVYADSGKSNLRRGPGLDEKIVCTFKKGDSALYLEESSFDARDVRWYHVRYGEREGWVSSRYTTLRYDNGVVEREFDHDVRAEAEVYVRNAPDLEGDILGVMKAGDEHIYLDVTTYDDRGVAWYRVALDNAWGWVSSRYCTIK